MKKAFTIMELIFVIIISSILITSIVPESTDETDVSVNKQKIQKVKITFGVEKAKTKEAVDFKSKYENVVILNKQLQSKVKSLQKKVIELEGRLDEVNSPIISADSYGTGY